MAIKFLSGQTISGTLTVSGNVQGATFNGLAINTTGTNNVANQIVRTQANGYVNFGWINSVSGNHTGSITRITASNDAYLRYVTPAQFRTGVTDGFYAPSSTVSGVTSVGGTGTVSGITLTGTVTSTGNLTLGGTLSASITNISNASNWWNNFGDVHGTRTGFDASTASYSFGWRYVQGNTNGPGTGGTQFYSAYVGLGSQYPATGSGSYGAYLAFDRNVANPYLSIRYNEANVLGTWKKISAGTADILTTARTIAGVSFNGSANISLNNNAITNGAGYTTNTGTVTSVNYTHQGNAFTVGGVPVTSSGTIAVTMAGSSSQYINGAGNLISFPTIPPDPTGVYLPLAGGIMSGNIGRSAYNSGYQVGGYNNIGASHAKTNPIHVIGTSYEPTATALSNMYGIGYTRADISFMGVAQGSGWGLYVASDGDARIFLDGSQGDIYATNKLCVNSYANQAGGLLFSAGQTTGTTRSLNLRTTNVTSDPSSSDGSNSTGITWGQRTDSNPYYIIKPTQLNFGGGNYSKLTLNWHTGIRIGGQKAYGGTKFYNDAPDIVGETGVIMNVGVGNDNIGVVNNLTVGSNLTFTGQNLRSTVGLFLQVDSGNVNAITIDNVGSTTFSGYTYFPNYLFHAGDTNTRIGFTTGVVTIRGDSGITLDGPTTAETIRSDDLFAKGMVRATGWYNTNTGNGTGYGVEIGQSGGQGYILSYSRDAAAYQALNIVGSYTLIENSTRSPIYYDSNNTAYYGHFDSYSSMRGVAIRGDLGASDIDNQIFFYGTGGTTTSAIGFKNGGQFANPTGNGDGWNTMLTMDTDGRGWVFRRGTGGANFTSAYTAGWILNNGIFQANASMRAPIFYDSNNTAYYVDPASTSNLNGLTVAGTITGTIETANKLAITGYQTNGQSFYQSSGSFAGFSGWHNYYIGNHGNGSNYYNTTIAFPFWGPPRYSRLEGGTFRGPYNFLTNETDQTIGVYLQSTTSLRAPIFYDYNNTAFYLDPSTTGTSVNVAGDVVAYASSDIRFKNNITPITNALDKLSKIGGYTFEWNEISHKETGKKDIGVVAQEVEEILPEIVQTRSNGYKAVDYQKLTALLIESVKEQQVIIDDLKSRIERLEKI